MTADPLDELFAPLGAEAFFANHWERSALHLRGDVARGHGMLSHARFEETLASLDGVPTGLTAFPDHLDASLDLEHLLRDPALVRAYLDAGHPVVWNGARGVWPTVDALTATLADTLGAHVWPNVYATGTAGTPLDAHFDAHEVIAVQCDGRKRWWTSTLRVDRPLDVDRMEQVIAHELRTRRDEALSRTHASFTACPGDLVYIPRGVFHNACTEEGRSLHVTFGIQLPTGYDALEVIAADVLGDPAFREYLPPAAADPDGARTAAELEAITARLRATLTVERVSAVVASLRASMIERSSAPASKRR